MIKNQLIRLWCRLRNPDHAGTDRQLFGRGLTAGIGIAISVVVVSVSRLAALLTVLGVTGIIIVRGLVFSGTPALVGRLHDAEAILQIQHLKWVLHLLRTQVIRKISSPGFHDTMSRAEGKQMLLSAEVLVREDARLHITDRFRQDWLNRIQMVRSDTQRTSNLLASAYGVDPGAVETTKQHNGSVVVTVDANRVGRWASEAALAADLTIAAALSQWVSDWVALDAYQQVTLVRTVRHVLDVCPGCGTHLGPLDRGDGVAASDNEYISVTCAECGSDLGSLPNQ